MDQQQPKARVDGSRLTVTVDLECGALVYLDEGDPPALVIDTGRGEILIGPPSADRDVLVVLADFVAAAEALRTSVSTRVLGGSATT
jgi:hypothetical protein